MGGTICRSRDPGQLGRGLVPLPWFIVNAVVKATNDAEDMLGYPPTMQEILVVLR